LTNPAPGRRGGSRHAGRRGRGDHPLRWILRIVFPTVRLVRPDGMDQATSRRM